jgi:hypothetical protein
VLVVISESVNTDETLHSRKRRTSKSRYPAKLASAWHACFTLSYRTPTHVPSCITMICHSCFLWTSALPGTFRLWIRHQMGNTPLIKGEVPEIRLDKGYGNRLEA